ncbi:MAG: aminoglycoside phosphotransferase family protein [Ktedonobacteraceae bacterium]
MTTTPPYPTLPGRLAEYVGPLHSIEYPPQGMDFKVYILSSARGRFVLKIADTPPMVKALANEAHILTALRDHVPFVAQPIGDAVESESQQTHAFLFTYVDGEPLHIVLKHTDMVGRRHLIVQFAQALRRIHSWEPDVPRPTNWLMDTFSWISANMLALPANTLVTGTNSRFDGTNARHLLADIQSWRTGISSDIVFGHYDYCLPNVLVQDNKVSGIIDWSGGGYIDRRFDLATALFTIRLANTLQDTSYLTDFLQGYGYKESIDTLYFFEALHALTCAFWQ